MRATEYFDTPINHIDVERLGGMHAHAAAHAINQHDKLVKAVRLFLAYNDARDDDDVDMMLAYADAVAAARDAISRELAVV